MLPIVIIFAVIIIMMAVGIIVYMNYGQPSNNSKKTDPLSSYDINSIKNKDIQFVNVATGNKLGIIIGDAFALNDGIMVWQYDGNDLIAENEEGNERIAIKANIILVRPDTAHIKINGKNITDEGEIKLTSGNDNSAKWLIKN